MDYLQPPLPKKIVFEIIDKDSMEQLNQSFSGSTPRAGGDKLQKSGKSLLSALQLMSISQIRTPKVLVRSFRPF